MIYIFQILKLCVCMLARSGLYGGWFVSWRPLPYHTAMNWSLSNQWLPHGQLYMEDPSIAVGWIWHKSGGGASEQSRDPDVWLLPTPQEPRYYLNFPSLWTSDYLLNSLSLSLSFSRPSKGIRPRRSEEHRPSPKAVPCPSGGGAKKPSGPTSRGGGGGAGGKVVDSRGRVGGVVRGGGGNWKSTPSSGSKRPIGRDKVCIDVIWLHNVMIIYFWISYCFKCVITMYMLLELWYRHWPDKCPFDPSGYDKDLVEALERDIVQTNPNVKWWGTRKIVSHLWMFFSGLVFLSDLVENVKW